MEVSINLQVADQDERPGDPLGDAAGLAALLRLRSEDWYSRRTAVEDLRVLRTRYHDAGYYFVDAEPRRSLDVQAAPASIDVRIRPGPVTTIERIDVAGATRIPEASIRKELLVKAGDRYRESRVAETADRLKALGLFRRVDVKYDRIEGHDDRVALTIQVEAK
ncbi:hypothetical protein LZC95_05965 [Pendulispora brunnea]|uniref:POTRA domain-containing protein n=1 Tax=Pendulispora brunnea TaxID=2905690 RepID=A0ABZ2KFU4_9BACT